MRKLAQRVRVATAARVTLVQAVAALSSATSKSTLGSDIAPATLDSNSRVVRRENKMKTRSVALATVIALGSCGVVFGDSINELAKRVEAFHQDYCKSLSNLHCNTEGDVAGTQFTG